MVCRKDSCPHRNAPLSQGRVDLQRTVLNVLITAGSWHRWSMHKDPQLDASFEGNIIPGSSVQSLKTHITGDILWAFTPLPEGQASFYQRLPEDIVPILPNVSRFTVRDLPYSFDFLIENFMDPAHIPFAHHGLQGLRTDGSPIATKTLYPLFDKTRVGISFTDIVRGKQRTGQITFEPPCYFSLHTAVPGQETKFGLLILCVPVAPGKSRVFVAPSPGRKIPKFVPQWFMIRFRTDFRYRHWTTIKKDTFVCL